MVHRVHFDGWLDALAAQIKVWAHAASVSNALDETTDSRHRVWCTALVTPNVSVLVVGGETISLPCRKRHRARIDAQKGHVRVM